MEGLSQDGFNPPVVPDVPGVPDASSQSLLPGLNFGTPRREPHAVSCGGTRPTDGTATQATFWNRSGKWGGGPLNRSLVGAFQAPLSLASLLAPRGREAEQLPNTCSL